MQAPGIQWNIPQTSSTFLTEQVDYKAKNKHFALLPINGSVYHSETGKWKCEIISHPNSDGNDLGCYRLKFDSQGYKKNMRYLSLWVSVVTLENDLDWRYKTAFSRIVSEWLAGPQSSSEIVVRG